MAENVVYSDKNVNITNARVVIDNTTYAVRNITSVKTSLTPASKVMCYFLMLMGVVLALIGIGVFLSYKDIGSIFIFLGTLEIICAFFLLSKCKPKYHVTIASSSGEVEAMTSKDKKYIDKIVSSINDAIATNH